LSEKTPLPVPTMAKPFACRDCGEMIFSPNVEAFEVLDAMICDDCANDALGEFEDDEE
jgi:hypothetical protein